MLSSPSVLLLNLASGEKLNLKSVNFPRNGISGDSSETQQIDQVFMKMENKMMPMVTILVIIMMVMIMMMMLVLAVVVVMRVIIDI